MAARAGVFENGVVRILGEVDGQPTTLAELRTEQGASWWPRGLWVKRGAQQWMPQAQADGLPEGGPCDLRPR